MKKMNTCVEMEFKKEERRDANVKGEKQTNNSKRDMKIVYSYHVAHLSYHRIILVITETMQSYAYKSS